MIADKNIGGAYVCRAFTLKGELLKPPRHLMFDEVIAIPFENRRALEDRGYLKVYWATDETTAAVTRRRKPAWDTPDERTQAWLMAWTCAELDRVDIEQQQDETDDDRALRSFLQLPPEARRDAIERARLPLAKARRRYGDLGPLRKLYPELAETFAPPSDWKQTLRRQEQAGLRTRKAQAVADYHRIEAIWHKAYGHRRRHKPPTADEIAAARHDLRPQDVEEARKRD